MFLITIKCVYTTQATYYLLHKQEKWEVYVFFSLPETVSTQGNIKIIKANGLLILRLFFEKKKDSSFFRDRRIPICFKESRKVIGKINVFFPFFVNFILKKLRVKDQFIFKSVTGIRSDNT